MGNIYTHGTSSLELGLPAKLSPVLSLHFRFQVKFFYLCQLAYWLHALPELYFQKVRKVSAGQAALQALQRLPHLVEPLASGFAVALRSKMPDCVHGTWGEVQGWGKHGCCMFPLR